MYFILHLELISICTSHVWLKATILDRGTLRRLPSTPAQTGLSGPPASARVGPSSYGCSSVSLYSAEMSLPKTSLSQWPYVNGSPHLFPTRAPRRSTVLGLLSFCNFFLLLAFPIVVYCLSSTTTL